jgi:hypothetical protein
MNSAFTREGMQVQPYRARLGQKPGEQRRAQDRAQDRPDLDTAEKGCPFTRSWMKLPAS